MDKNVPSLLVFFPTHFCLTPASLMRLVSAFLESQNVNLLFVEAGECTRLHISRAIPCAVCLFARRAPRKPPQCSTRVAGILLDKTNRLNALLSAVQHVLFFNEADTFCMFLSPGMIYLTMMRVNVAGSNTQAPYGRKES